MPRQIYSEIILIAISLSIALTFLCTILCLSYWFSNFWLYMQYLYKKNINIQKLSFYMQYLYLKKHKYTKALLTFQILQPIIYCGRTFKLTYWKTNNCNALVSYSSIKISNKHKNDKNVIKELLVLYSSNKCYTLWNNEIFRFCLNLSILYSQLLVGWMRSVKKEALLNKKIATIITNQVHWIKT